MTPVARTTLRLAVADFRAEWRVSLCLVLALAAVLAPLLVLFGLKYGIVSSLRDRLVADPRNLEIVVVGNYRLAPDWFASLAQHPGVGFLIPRTRSLAATADLIAADNRALAGVELIPSAAGDPLLRGAPAPDGQRVLLSASAAQRLRVAAGDTVTLQVSRQIGGRFEAERRPVVVAALLPEDSFGRDGLFVSLDLLVAAEDYRDGRADPPPAGQRIFASLRLFARDFDAVPVLALRLRDEGFEIRTRADEIEMVKAIDRTLSFLFLLIAVIAVGGYLLSLAASLWANVDRKRRDLALMRLIGFPPAAALAFPAIQASLIALCGSALSVLMAEAVALVVNLNLADNLDRSEFVCRLRPLDLLVAAILTLLFALIASALGGYRAARIDPAESLRDV